MLAACNFGIAEAINLCGAVAGLMDAGFLGRQQRGTCFLGD